MGREKGLVSLRAQHQPQGTTELSLGNSQWTLEQSIDSFSKRRYKTRAKPTVHKTVHCPVKRELCPQARTLYTILKFSTQARRLFEYCKPVQYYLSLLIKTGPVGMSFKICRRPHSHMLIVFSPDDGITDARGARFYRLLKGGS